MSVEINWLSYLLCYDYAMFIIIYASSQRCVKLWLCRSTACVKVESEFSIFPSLMINIHVCILLAFSGLADDERHHNACCQYLKRQMKFVFSVLLFTIKLLQSYMYQYTYPLSKSVKMRGLESLWFEERALE